MDPAPKKKSHLSFGAVFRCFLSFVFLAIALYFILSPYNPSFMKGWLFPWTEYNSLTCLFFYVLLPSAVIGFSYLVFGVPFRFIYCFLLDAAYGTLAFLNSKMMVYFIAGSISVVLMMIGHLKEALSNKQFGLDRSFTLDAIVPLLGATRCFRVFGSDNEERSNIIFGYLLGLFLIILPIVSITLVAMKGSYVSFDFAEYANKPRNNFERFIYLFGIWERITTFWPSLFKAFPITLMPLFGCLIIMHANDEEGPRRTIFAILGGTIFVFFLAMFAWKFLSSLVSFLFISGSAFGADLFVASPYFMACLFAAGIDLACLFITSDFVNSQSASFATFLCAIALFVREMLTSWMNALLGVIIVVAAGVVIVIVLGVIGSGGGGGGTRRVYIGESGRKYDTAGQAEDDCAGSAIDDD
jgi:hypothetical protein